VATITEAEVVSRASRVGSADGRGRRRHGGCWWGRGPGGGWESSGSRRMQRSTRGSDDVCGWARGEDHGFAGATGRQWKTIRAQNWCRHGRARRPTFPATDDVRGEVVRRVEGRDCASLVDSRFVCDLVGDGRVDGGLVVGGLVGGGLVCGGLVGLGSFRLREIGVWLGVITGRFHGAGRERRACG
jgi:hypothetical protein